jgi:hypothetical protein
MAKSISARKKKRGRPATGITPMIGLRATPQLRTAIEAWAKQQPDTPRLSEAVRRLVEIALADAQPLAPTSKKTAARATKLANKIIDRLGDKSAPREVQEERKRRLLKGPPEFREIRSDLPKPKGALRLKSSGTRRAKGLTVTS